MAHVSDLIAADIERYLNAHERKGLLRFITCGSVDDGKSTLIGRLLYESKLLFDDQLAALAARLARSSAPRATTSTSRCWSTASPPSASRASPSTSPTASSRPSGASSSSPTRPGHEQYTRNMVTGASTADAAVLLVDARKGVLTQTRRHSYLVSLLGIRHVALGGQQDGSRRTTRRSASARSRAQYRDFAKQIGLADVTCIPVSALKGDNMLAPSPHTPWYRGADPDGLAGDGRGRRDSGCSSCRSACRCSGSTVRTWISAASPARSRAAAVKPGDRVRVQPSGKESRVARIVTAERRSGAGRGRAVDHAHARRRDRRLARRRDLGRGARPPRWPTSSRRRSSG